MRILFGLVMSLVSSVALSSEIEFEKFDGGFVAMYQQADPFDKSKKKYLQFSKGDFWFNCSEISFIARDDTSFDSFDFDAKVAIKVDEEPVEEQTGIYSSYLFGSDMVNDQRVYSTRMGPWLVSLFKNGDSLQAAGKWGTSGWTSKSIELKGFTATYDKVCKY